MAKFPRKQSVPCTACIDADAAKATTPPSQIMSQFTKFEMPLFIPDDVALWWKQIEARPDMTKIIEEQNEFKHIIAGLPPEVVFKMSDLVFKPTADNLCHDVNVSRKNTNLLTARKFAVC